MGQMQSRTAAGPSRRAPKTTALLRDQALQFLDHLRPDQMERAEFPFDAGERFRWHYTPIERRGLPLGELTTDQKQRAMDLLGAGLSPKGLHQAQAIIKHEDILREIEDREGRRRWPRDPGLYFFSIFGDPANLDPWSVRIEGHHLSVHLTVVDGELLAATPSFFGANPARVPSGPLAGYRIHPLIEDLGRELAVSLAPSQRVQGILSDEAPDDILTTNSTRVSLERMGGLPAGAMNEPQRETLVWLLEEYVGRKAMEVAYRDLHVIMELDGLEDLRFAWAGSLEAGRPHYYRIQGPSVLIEYDNRQDGANHIHSVWRDIEGDFGMDLLQMHYQQAHSQP